MSAGPIFVTGGAGFIGSALTRRLVADGRPVVVIDKLTYAANLDSLRPVQHLPGFAFEQVDICDASALTALFERYHPSSIFHLAAESHVDRSIDGPADFVHTNLIGTYTLLEAARVYRMRATRTIRSLFRFIHVSTDEVFGSLGPDGRFDEGTAYDPHSPYSATKAGSDHLARAWLHTFGLPVIVTNCSNNYGPFQFPEKLIPLMTLNALEGRSLPVYGEGKNIRDWLYVEDHVEALIAVLDRGTIGDTYAIGGGDERRNLDVVRDICLLVDDLTPRLPLPRTELIEFVADRPGHDQRYAIDASHIREQLGWQPRHSYEQGLRDTVVWYLENREWWQRVKSGAYRRERLGLANA